MDLPEDYIVILLHEGNINLKLKKVVVTNTLDSLIFTNNDRGGVYSYTQVPKHLIKSIEIREESYTLDTGLTIMLELLKKEDTIVEISN